MPNANFIKDGIKSHPDKEVRKILKDVFNEFDPDNPLHNVNDFKEFRDKLITKLDEIGAYVKVDTGAASVTDTEST